MQFLFVGIPLALFFAAYKLYDFFVATALLMASITLLLGVEWLIKRRVSRMHVISTVLVIVFGGVTIMFRDQIFLQWKVTIINWLFALVLVGTQWFTKKPAIQHLFEEALKDQPNTDGDDPAGAMDLSALQWRQLNYAWAAFFFAIGVLNLIVAYRFPEETWVNFKVFGILGMTLVFAIGQALWMSAKMQSGKDSATDN